MKESTPVSMDDIPELARMLSGVLVHHPVSESRLKRLLFGNPGFDPALSRAIRGADGRIESFVSAVNLPELGGRKRAELVVLATRQDRQGCGLMRELYREVETTLRARGVHEIVINGGLIPSGLDLRYHAATTALLRRLYVQTATGYDMTLGPLTVVPDGVVAPAGYAVRELTRADAAALEELCAGEFSGWAGVSASIGLGPHSGMMGVFDLASGGLAAFAGFDEYIFFSTGTSSKHRRKGLGTVVFWAAVKRLLAAMPGTPVLIGHANIGFYARAFACHIRSTVWRMRKDLSADAAVSKGKAANVKGDGE